MEQDYRVFTIRRLFKEDGERIERYTNCFANLYFTPFTEDYIWQIFLQGAFWAVFEGEKLAALTYILPADSPAFSALDAYWHIEDLLGCSMENTLLCGYMWTDEKYSGTDFYAPVAKLWVQQAHRRNRQLLVHYMPAHMSFDMENLLNSGFDIVGLRGLDNLVPHYIFTKMADYGTRDTKSFTDIVKCQQKDTKTISKLCEHGYKGFDMDVEKNILFGR